MIITRLLIAALFALSLAACEKSPDTEHQCPDGVTVTFRDLSGLDGCGYVLELADGTRLEVANLNELDITPEDGLKVRVKYSAPLDMASICMVGPIVRVECIALLQK